MLGGNGFIGRHAVEALLAQDALVTIGSRHAATTSTRAAAAAVDVVQVRMQSRLTPSDWHELVQRFDVILNCVGILRQRPGETYDHVHHLAPAALAAACAQSGTRFVHVSALGLTASARSRFLTSKFHGDEAIKRGGGDWLIARLSLLDGEGGFGASWLRGIARLPVFVVPTSARGEIAAMMATDAGSALAQLCLTESPDAQKRDIGRDLERSRIFELGGEHNYGFADYVAGLRARYSTRPAVVLRVPGWMARLAAHCCDLLHFSPFSFGHWELLCSDNVPAPNRLAELLGRPPEPVLPPPASD